MSDSDRDDLHDLAAHGPHVERDILILYATETGNALDAAESIWRYATNKQFKARIHSIDDYPLVRCMILWDPFELKYVQSELIHEELVVFVISTIGSGQEPRTMSGLWKMLLRSDLPEDLFEGLDFAVFGLGDSSYETFCWAAKKLERRLESLGANEICKRGEGDDQHHMGHVHRNFL